MVYLEKRNSLVKQKLLYTLLIILVYLLGRELPLYMIDVSAYLHKQVDAETLLLQTINGDIYQCSLFALGISPYMISSIIIQMLSAFRSSETRKKISPTKTNRRVLTLTLVLALLLAVVRVQNLQYRVDGDMLIYAKLISVIEMVAGAMMILYLASRNQKYGIGGQSALIFVNVVDGIMVTLRGYGIDQLILPLLISMIVMLVMIVMENAEKRIPVQRISIHNIYADKNYLAIKLNPIGVMPAMFSMAFFMLVQVLTSVLTWFFPENTDALWWNDNLTLSKPVGIVAYILILYILAIGFSRVFVNPGEITEQFLKSGDSIQGLHAGRDTKRYLSRTITRISLLSATVMSVCLSIPMILQMTGKMGSSFTTLPSSIMMLTGIWCNLYREVMAVRDLDAYKPFI